MVWRPVMFRLVAFILLSRVASIAQPNIIFILTDDQSYETLSCTGNNTVDTPNIDQLAEDGTLFTNAYVTSAICTPSRISILLSQYERMHGVNFNSGTSVSEEAWADSYPVQMRKSGYYTGWIGKNHAPIGKGGYESAVMKASFDYWYAGNGHLGFYPKERHAIFAGASEDTQVEIITEGALHFLDSNKKKMKGAMSFLDKRPKDQPFLLNINLNLPHGAGTSSMQQRPGDDEIYKSLYRDRQIDLPKNYLPKNEIKKPKLPPDLHLAGERQQGYSYVDEAGQTRERLTRQYQAITGIDRMLGELREHLSALGLGETTIIVFTSDHGLFMGEQGLGGKALCYEKVTHVPLIIYDPSLKKEQVPESNALVQLVDIAPTFLEIAASKIPSSYQGQNLRHLLTGEEKSLRKYIYTENLWSNHFGNPRCEAVQDHDWKYIRYYKNNNLPASKRIEVAEALGIDRNRILYGIHDPDIATYRTYVDSPVLGEKAVYEELYDLKNDPEELHNLADEKAHEMRMEKLRDVWQKEILSARGSDQPKVLRYTVDSKAE